MYRSIKLRDTTTLNTKSASGMIAGAHTRPSGQSQRIITPPSWKVRVLSTYQSRNQNSQSPRIPPEKHKNERIEYLVIILSHHPRQRRWHHHIPKHKERASHGGAANYGSRRPNEPARFLLPKRRRRAQHQLFPSHTNAPRAW